MRSRSPGRRRRASRRSRRSGCGRWPRCSPATFSRAWRSTAARPSTAGSRRSGAGSAAATRRCWSTSSAAFRTTRRSGTWSKWLELAPFDRRVHELLLNALARRGRIREGEEHLAATARLFEAEGLDCTPLRDAWRSARAQGDGPPRVRPPLPPRRRQQPASRDDVVAVAPRRASIAVMPFVDRSAAAGARGGAADALAHDVITRLAKLRSLFVIAQGTVFALHERRVGPEEAGRMLNVDYVVSGSVRRQGKRLTVTVELAETRTARIVWAEVFDHKLDDAFLVLDEIGNRIVASIASEIETIERNRAILQAAELARRVGGASPRPVAHVPVQQARQRAGPAFLRDGGAPRSDLRARLCRPVLHAFPERLPGLGGARAGDRPRLRGRRAKPHGRRSRPRRALGDGPGALAARPPRPVRRRAGAGGRPQPELRAGPLHARLRPLAGRRSRAPPSRPPTTRAS